MDVLGSLSVDNVDKSVGNVEGGFDAAFPMEVMKTALTKLTL